MDETIRYKLLRLALPLPLLAAAFATVYSVANWFLVGSSGLIPIDEDLVTFWLPFVLACFLVGFLISPHIRVLDIEGKRNDPKFLYQIAAVAAVAVPAILAQVYVKNASGTLTHMRDASQIALVPAAKYYDFDNVCVDRARAKAHTAFWTLGRNNETLELALYVVAPLCGEDVRTQPLVWIGETFEKSINNRLSGPQKEALYRAFVLKTQRDYDAENPRDVRYFERAGVNFARHNFEKALREAGVSAATILIPHTDAFARRTGDMLVWAFRTLGIGAAIWFVLIMLTPADYGKVAGALLPEEIEKAQLEKEGSREATLWLFVPRPGLYGLPVLMDINLGVFFAMVFSGLGVVSFQIDDIVDWGAQYGPLMHGLGYLRLISSQFVHQGLMHVGQNMYGLLFAGFFLLPVMRNWGLISAYLLCGLAGSVATNVLYPNIVSEGASGAVMGLWGILIVLALLNDPRVTGARTPILINIGLFTALTLAFGAVEPGVNNAAHIAGFAAGVILGGLVTIFRPEVTDDMPAWRAE